MLLYEKALWYLDNTNWPLRDILDALIVQFQIVYEDAVAASVWAMGKYYGPEC